MLNMCLIKLTLEMPRGKYLTLEEKAKISAWRDPTLDRVLSISEISRKLGRSRTVIRSFLRLGQNYGVKKATKGNRKLTNRQKQQIIHEAVVNRKNSTEIRDYLQLPVHPQHVNAILRGSGKVKWSKDLKKPMLKPHHKIARLEFCQRHMTWSSEWHRVIFSDEKKFNLDGPDMCNFYWHGLNQPEDPKGSRNFGGGNVMIWGAFSALGTATLCFVSNRMNSGDYTEVLDCSLIPYMERFPDVEFVFQQDNAAIHASRHTIDWLGARGIPVLEWPSCSPDINPIENLWAILARRVYGNPSQKRTFSTKEELKSRIQLEWSQIEEELLISLARSMTNRVYQVILKNGGATSY